MRQVSDEPIESGRKRARTENAPCLLATSSSTSSSSSDDIRTIEMQIEKDDATSTFTPIIDVKKRAIELSTQLAALSKDFPEMRLMFDFENLQKVETTVENYNAKVLLNRRDESVSLYSLPDEILLKCLSFVGKGHYGLVALASKKLCKAYKEEFGKDGIKTSYLEAAMTMNTVQYCIEEGKLSRWTSGQDELFKAAAVNGNVDILRYAVSSGHDLFPLIEMKKEKMYEGCNSDCSYEDEDSDDSYCHLYGHENLAKIVERGHLHVLKFLKEELNHHWGLQKYCIPAIEFGQLEILKWLKSVGCIDQDDFLYKNRIDFCQIAVRSGKIEVLKWLLSEGYHFKHGLANDSVITNAIATKSIEMIQYCLDLGYDFNVYYIEDAIKSTKSIEVYSALYDLGYEFQEIKELADYYDLEFSFKVVKFLRSKSIPWGENMMKDIVRHDNLELIQYAHENGCPWTTTGDEFYALIDRRNFRLESFKYLADNGCSFDYTSSSRCDQITTKLSYETEFAVLDHFVGKDSTFDNQLFEKMLRNGYWTEGIKYMINNGVGIHLKYNSIQEIFALECHDIDVIKYFRSSLSLPWTLDETEKTMFLSQIACWNNLEGVKWALENGCEGGHQVSYVRDEWHDLINGIRGSFTSWRENHKFFEENGMLSFTIEDIGDDQIAPGMIQKFGYEYLNFLEFLINHGYAFPSHTKKQIMIKDAFKRSCHSASYENRKILSLFQQMEVREL
ncbi:hypothetical protein CTEN210_02792 [Chaetoceros tenuissimus]|uniref:Uncharacterized protein n=1 Tax=Chaetoceros tenuissimus TaxID=426638 RepID=A0AAD3CIL5_9STRA|nr:hypothetical protein CTEN210_02792 [Chaetoceros tenuissimus]